MQTTLITPSARLEPGVYDVRIAMVDDKWKPAIRLGIEGEDQQLRYKLGTIRILPSRKK